MLALDPASNPEKKCLACGRTLAAVRTGPRPEDWAKMPKSTVDWHADDVTRDQQRLNDERSLRAWRRAHSSPTGACGRNGNNAFCTATCAERFAVLAATAGYRLRGR